eukprot:4782642-Prymnesium_polylepis.1
MDLAESFVIVSYVVTPEKECAWLRARPGVSPSSCVFNAEAISDFTEITRLARAGRTQTAIRVSGNAGPHA